MIPQHIPTDYLEGYNKLLAKAKMLKWPKNPKAIFTSNSYSCCLYDLKKYASGDYCFIDYSHLLNDSFKVNKMLNNKLHNIGINKYDYDLTIINPKYPQYIYRSHICPIVTNGVIIAAKNKRIPKRNRLKESLFFKFLS